MKHAIPVYLLSASAALAHPGHAEADAQGAAHWLSMGSHLMVLVLVAALAGLVLRRRRRSPARREEKDAGHA